jgi:hypothetical protein
VPAHVLRKYLDRGEVAYFRGCVCQVGVAHFDARVWPISQGVRHLPCVLRATALGGLTSFRQR